ncbi:MAG: HAMP domain-containing protein, partial [Herpetosiphonaceae bacterium]|nr:HAMP domain-containing protein [Herpetosiphonaceae bacterium]
MRISIRRLVGIGLLLITVLFAVLVIVNSTSVSAYRENTLLIAQEILPQQQLLNKLRATLSDTRFESLMYVVTNEEQHRLAHVAADARTRELMAELSALLNQDTTNQETDNNAFGVVTTTVNRLLTLTEEATIRQRNAQNASALEIVGQFDNAMLVANNALNTFEANLQGESNQVVLTAQRNPLTLTRIIGIITFAMIVIFFSTLIRMVARPLKRLQTATLAVAAGDRSQRVEIVNQNELGDLATAFNTMVEQVAEQERLQEQQLANARAARREAEAARAEIGAQLATIEQQRAVIQEMTVPILPLSSTAIVLPLIGALDSSRLMSLEERALHAVQEGKIR